MKDLIQRLRGVGHDYDFHGNALICEASDALEKQQVEIERLKIQWAKLSEAVYLLSEGNVTLIKERDSLKVQINELASAHSNVLCENDSLKAQAAKDAADAGRRVAVITLYHGAGLAAANYIDQLGGVSKHYRVTLEAMKESQQ